MSVEATVTPGTEPGRTGQSLEPEGIDFSKGGGYVPAIVQHADTGSVLMLGYMNREALQATVTGGKVVFFSRSKQRLWEKGETSGHTLRLADIRMDCDRDALLVRAWPQGPTCHQGTPTCFGDGFPASEPHLNFLSTLEQLIAERITTRPEGSHTARLIEGGVPRIAQKVGEEALEVALAAVGGSKDEIVAESADLIYHLLVLLKARGLTLGAVVAELLTRHTAPKAISGRCRAPPPIG
jgi:phosphoribosyl-ATP pyrophosphohydrolase/phosphoribosyl-AMP cyclohydrolase